MDGAAIPDSTREELVELGKQDQLLRADLGPERMKDTAFLRQLRQGDSVRTERLRVLVERYGWPDTVRTGSAAASAAFLILQHSPDHAFQKAMAPRLEELSRQGALPRQEVALLIDRVLMHDGLPQRYGTQFNLKDGRWVMHPVEDEANLDSLRQAMELPPMDVYMKMMEEVYKAPAVRR
jgi:hypothetical protein